MINVDTLALDDVIKGAYNKILTKICQESMSCEISEGVKIASTCHE